MINPRDIAVEALKRIKFDGAYANLISNDLTSRHKLSQLDASLVTDLINGTTRYLRYLDFTLEKVSNRSLKEIEPDLLIVLEISAYSHLIRNIAPHAVVNEGVELARRIVGERAVGFVNGVLRKYVQNDKQYWEKIINREKDDTEALGIKYSFPDWIISHFSTQFSDRKKLESFLECLNRPPEVTFLRPPNLHSVLSDLKPGNWSPFAFKRQNRISVGQSVLTSKLIVQDEGSQLVALASLLTPVDGKDINWLDLTAGPGGKSVFLASWARSRKAKLSANELHPHRAKLITESALRLKLDINTTVGDSLTQEWEQEFDRVLVDAPCSGLGALRRRSEARWRKQEIDLVQLVDLQKKLLTRAINLTRSGGIVAYTTCSLHPRETVEVVELAAKVTKIEIIDATQMLPWVPMERGPFLRLWPHIHDTDGMFLALLKVG